MTLSTLVKTLIIEKNFAPSFICAANHALLSHPLFLGLKENSPISVFSPVPITIPLHFPADIFVPCENERKKFKLTNIFYLSHLNIFTCYLQNEIHVQIHVPLLFCYF